MGLGKSPLSGRIMGQQTPVRSSCNIPVAGGGKDTKREEWDRTGSGVVGRIRAILWNRGSESGQAVIFNGRNISQRNAMATILEVIFSTNISMWKSAKEKEASRKTIHY